MKPLSDVGRIGEWRLIFVIRKLTKEIMRWSGFWDFQSLFWGNFYENGIWGT